MSYLVNENKSKLLEDEIKEAEWQILKRQQVVDLRTTTLVQKVYQQLTDPGSLLVAGGVGFILGEMTKRQISKSQVSKSRRTTDKDKPRATETSPLKVAMNLMTSAQTLYTALPLLWVIKSRFQQPNASAEAAEQKPHSAPIPATRLNRRRSMS